MAVIRPGPPAVCPGTVVHRRHHPTEHAFTYPVSYCWFDPDVPEALCDSSRLWSVGRTNLVSFRRQDYGPLSPEGRRRPLGPALVDAVEAASGLRPGGAVRMLTQLRRWGWLFNPITVYLLWNAGEVDEPSAAVLEVTNTPWKERTWYPVTLETDGAVMAAIFDKALHVSPFLEMEYRYHLRLSGGLDRLAIDLDVIDGSDDDGSLTPVLSTGLRLSRQPATSTSLHGSILHDGASTHRVSIAIHRQAARLWSKGVEFVAHPSKQPAAAMEPRVERSRHSIDSRAPGGTR